MRCHGYPYPIKAAHDEAHWTKQDRVGLRKQIIDAAVAAGMKRSAFTDVSQRPACLKEPDAIERSRSLVSALGGNPQRFGVLAESSTTQLRVIARNNDVAVGDLFLIPSQRGSERVYVFRTTQYANIMNRTLEMGDVARNKLTLPDVYFSEDLAEETLLELSGMLLGYAEVQDSGAWAFRRPRRLPDHLADVYRVTAADPQMPVVMQTLLQAQLGDAEQDLVLGDLLAGEQALPGVPVSLPVAALSHHLGIFGRTGSGKSNLMMVLIRAVFEHNRLLRVGQRSGRRASFWPLIHMMSSAPGMQHPVVQTGCVV